MRSLRDTDEAALPKKRDLACLFSRSGDIHKSSRANYLDPLTEPVVN